MSKSKKTNKKKIVNQYQTKKKITEQPKKKTESFKNYYILIGCLATIVFICMYGIRILNPTYIDWLFAGNVDILQHYIGWEAFRMGKWTFPIGLTNTISYPTQISIIFTDCIPIAAIFLKLISFILPKTFQYLGLYGLICTILQAILSAKIIRKYTSSKITVVVSSMLFTVVPTVIYRMFYHTALSSQWLLLIALDTIFLYDDYKEGKKIYYIWILLAFLISTIHIYYLVMCGIILVGYIILDILNTKKVKKSIILLSSYILTALASIYLLGGFYNNVPNDSFGFGKYSFNLNGLINPQSWSVFIRNMPMLKDQYEGFSYLGLGVIILIIIAMITSIIWIKKEKNILKENKNIIISLLIISIISVIVALSPKVYLGKTLLFELKLPSFLNELWSIFRSTGRFVWPVINIIMLSSIIIILKRFKWQNALLIISICLFIQIIDLGVVLGTRRSYYSAVIKRKERVDIASFEKLESLINNNDIKLLVLANKDMYDDTKMFYIDWALNNNIKSNRMRFARSGFDKLLDSNTEKYLKNKDESKVYIFDNKNDCIGNELYCYELPDGNYVGYIKEIN